MARPTKAKRARPRKPRATAAKSVAKPAVARPVTVVGIGASAGGLEALEQFLKAVPARSGLAYVIVQHLDPNHRANVFVELLQRASSLPIAQAEHDMPIVADHIYVTPPNHNIAVAGDLLQLSPLAEPRSVRLPIDVLFRSLAEDRRERAIGVILSGMGSDGTLGLRAIKEKAGVAFVQAVTSAKFHGMPQSAIEAGLADVVAPADQLPAKIIAYRDHAARLEHPTIELPQSDLDKIYLLLRAHTGNDFSAYKRSTIARRIERRMGLHQLNTLAQYVRFLRENSREIELLFKELLIGVTAFFRDPAAWDYLRDEILPAMVAEGGVFRAWVPGCSTGEEAYSLAMVFKEVVDHQRPKHATSLQVFATDLDRDAIDRARQATYPDNIAADVTPDRLRRFFIQDDRGFRVSKDIREMVVFATQNVSTDPPFTKLDLLSCRNLMIYFSAELQKRLVPLFHYSLKPGGVLFLGGSETVGSMSGLFAPLDPKARLYRRLDQTINAQVPVAFPAPVKLPSAQLAEPDGRLKIPPNLQTLVDRILVQRFSPLAVLCNDKGDILYLSARAGKYFEPTVGKANLNVFAMAREGLRYELTSAFAEALRHDRIVTSRGIKVGTDAGRHIVDLTVQRLKEPKDIGGTVLVVVAEVTAASPTKATARSGERPRMAELEGELQHAREEVQTAHEEMQTSQEELKSANEELQSTNEELQSSNEELMTSKEEMQSLNEELQTVNHELESKVDELSRSNNDMKNLLNSTDIATLFLDGDLNVRRFTPPTAKIIKLISSDTGRAITDIVSDLDYSQLADDAREVLRTLVFKEKQVGSRDGRWFIVRIMPYRTLENRIDGIVITFTDASSARALEAALRDQANQLRQMTESLPCLVWAARPDGSCDYISRQWVEYTGVTEAEQLGYGWLEQIHADDRSRVREEWRTAVRSGHTFDSEFRLRSRHGEYRWFKARSIAIRDSREGVQKWYGTSTDVDDLKKDRHE